MRLLIDAHVFDGKYQGSRTYLEGLYKALIEKLYHTDASIELFFAAHDTAGLQHVFGDHQFVHYLQIPSGNRLLRLLWYYPLILKRWKIDVAHFQYVIPLYNKCRYVNTIHDLLFLDFPQYFSFKYRIARQFSFRWSYLRSAVILTVSEYCKQRIAHHFGYQKQILVLGNGIPESLIYYQPEITAEAWREQNGLRNYLICVSRFEPRKNQHALLKAFVDGKHYLEYDLLFIGARSEPYAAFEELLRTMPLEARNAVHIWDRGVPTDKLYTSMKYAQLLVYPSLAEGFGLPPLEAYVLGTPVLCSNRTAMASFDFLGRGLIDIDKLPAQLYDALNIGYIGASIKEKEDVCHKYSWKQQAARLISVLQSMS